MEAVKSQSFSESNFSPHLELRLVNSNFTKNSFFLVLYGEKQCMFSFVETLLKFILAIINVRDVSTKLNM